MQYFPYGYMSLVGGNKGLILEKMNETYAIWFQHDSEIRYLRIVMMNPLFLKYSMYVVREYFETVI